MSEESLPDNNHQDGELIEKARSPFSEAFEMFRRNHGAMAGLLVLTFVVLVAIFGNQPITPGFAN